MPTFDRLKASWRMPNRSCSRRSRSSITSRGLYSSFTAAGVAGRVDRRVAVVRGVAGGGADPGEPVDRRQSADQLGEAASVVRPGVHVLAEQDDLARPAVDQGTRLGEDLVPRPRDFGAAGI